MQVLRWWMFEGDDHQIIRNSRGAPAGIAPAVYDDIDAALQLAQSEGVYYNFVRFSSPTGIPPRGSLIRGNASTFRCS